MKTTPSDTFPFVFRPMREEDIGQVMEIERQSFPIPWPESAYRHEIRYGVDSLFYVLEPYQERPLATWWDRLLGRYDRARPPVVGYVGMRLISGEAHITTIAVHPRWRGRGLGKYILLSAIERAAHHHARWITLEVRASNYVAQRLYTEVGFRFMGVQRGYYRDGEDAWLMRLGPLDREEMERLEEIRRETEARIGGAGGGGREA